MAAEHEGTSGSFDGAGGNGGDHGQRPDGAEDALVELLRREAVRPVRLVAVGRAGDLWPALARERVLLHAGPPLDGAEPTPAMRGALVGALLFEGAAGSIDEAERLLDSGAYELVSCHEAGGVGAMAGVVSPAVPVVAVEREDGRRAYAPVNEGLGRALRFGDFDPETLANLRRLADVVTPALDAGLRAAAPLDVVGLQADALRRGDEGHNRNVAATAMLATRLAPSIVRANRPAAAEAALQELADNPHFFLSISMAAGKAIADALHALALPGLVTGIASNGHGTGIRVGGLEGWITVTPPAPELRLFDGFALEDVAPAMGDSSVVETIGLGAMSFTAAPGLVRALGWSLDRARAHLQEMRRICVTSSPVYEIPDSDFAGAPLGISVARVLAQGVAPAFTSGFSHRELGRGRVGFGLARVGMAAFEEAAQRLAGAEEALA